MKRTLIAIGMLAGIGTAALAAEPASNQIEFKFKFEPGRSTAQRVSSTSVGTMILPGPLPEQKFTQVFEQVLTSTCRKVNEDKSAVFDIVMSDVAMRMTMGGFKIEYDSRTFDPKTADPAEALMGKVLGGMKGASFSATISENGRPLKIEGLAASMKAAMSKLGADGDPAELKGFYDQLANLMNDDTMNEQMQSFYRMTPTKEGPIKLGEKWEQTWSMKMPLVGGDFEGKGEYELVGIEEFKGRKCAKIKVKESFKMRPGPKDAPAPVNDSAIAGMLAGMQMELSTSGGEGVVYVDYERGELVRMRQTQNLHLSMKIPVPVGDETEGQEMPPFTMKMRNSVSVDLVDPSGKNKDDEPAR